MAEPLDLHKNGKGAQHANAVRFDEALRAIVVSLAGDPYPAHHEGERRRRRKYDGRWAKLDRREHLPPHWKAARKRKRVGVIGAFCFATRRAFAPTNRMVLDFQQQMEGVGANMAAWIASGIDGSAGMDGLGDGHDE